MAIADVYDALVSDRPYKKAFPHEKSVEIIREGRGKHFDSQIVDLFLEINELFRKVNS
jgi:HD-GYP domain-containing protein (c-di-GMP phosphodiesterase class II)